MNIKQLMLTLAAGFALSATAQTQGYMDGVEYFKVDQLDNAREILQRTFDAPETNRADAL